MNLLKTFQLKWWQGSIFKICMISLGLIIGSTWSAFFRNWIVVVGIICIITMLYITYVWWKQ